MKRRKLTPQEAAAKRERKVIGPKGGETVAALFRIERLADKRLRFKVSVNASQYHLVGRVAGRGRCDVVLHCALRALRDALCRGHQEGDAPLHQAAHAPHSME